MHNRYGHPKLCGSAKYRGKIIEIKEDKGNVKYLYMSDDNYLEVANEIDFDEIE